MDIIRPYLHTESQEQVKRTQYLVIAINILEKVGNYFAHKKVFHVLSLMNFLIKFKKKKLKTVNLLSNSVI